MCAYRIKRFEQLGKHSFDIYDVSDSEEYIGQDDSFLHYMFTSSCDKIQEKHNNWSREVDTLLARMETLSTGTKLPSTKFKVLKTGEDIQFFEMKTKHLRAYGFIDISNRYIFCFIGSKKEQKKHIPSLYRRYELIAKAGYYSRNSNYENRPPFLFTRRYDALSHPIKLTYPQSE